MKKSRLVTVSPSAPEVGNKPTNWLLGVKAVVCQLPRNYFDTKWYLAVPQCSTAPEKVAKGAFDRS